MADMEALEAKLVAAIAPGVIPTAATPPPIVFAPAATPWTGASVAKRIWAAILKIPLTMPVFARRAFGAIKGFSPMGFLSLLRLGSVSPSLIAAGVIAVASFTGGYHLKSRLDEATIADMKIAALQETDRQNKVAVGAVEAANGRERAAIAMSQKATAAIRNMRFSKTAGGCNLSPSDAKGLRLK